MKLRIAQAQGSYLLITGGLAPERITALSSVRASGISLPVVFLSENITEAEIGSLSSEGAVACFRSLGDQGDLSSFEAFPGITNFHSKALKQPGAVSGFGLKGDSEAIRQVGATIELVAQRRCTVLITGESGTGKEVAARAIHALSPRHKRPFLAINCGAIPEHLLEAELFGHVKGAFTGAFERRIGWFEQAHMGTLMLDEIAEMPLQLQCKLLRVLQEREVQRLGSSDSTPVDFRLIAATNVDLARRVEEGTFREDLYYRLNVVRLKMPALRERRNDIPALAEYLLERVCRHERLRVKRLTPDAIETLSAMPWPGNVRQLENALESAVILSGDREVISAADIARPGELRVVTPREGINDGNLDEALQNAIALGLEATVSDFRKKIISRAIERTNGNKSAAAGLLGIKRTTLMMKIRPQGAVPRGDSSDETRKFLQLVDER